MPTSKRAHIVGIVGALYCVATILPVDARADVVTDVASSATADNGIRGLASCTTVHAGQLYNICDYSIAVAWCEGDPCIGPYSKIKVLKPRHRTELTRASLPRQIVAGERFMTLIASRSKEAALAEVTRRNAQGNFVAGRVGVR